MSKFLEVRGARTHNLKNVDVKIPKNTLTVITGLSWSGKSSLAFSTIYSIGQQKYLESLSSYARMFVWWWKDEALYDEITGLSPTISIDQKTTNRNPRSTVGTITEIYDYYKLLYLNIWERRCVKCESVIKKDSVRDIINFISEHGEGTKYYISCPFLRNKTALNPETIKKHVLDAGFIRFLINEKEYNVNTDFEIPKGDINIEIIVDRLVVKDISNNESPDLKRLKDSISVAYKNGDGQLSVHVLWVEQSKKDFSQVFVCSNCWHVPEKLSISSFSFNSHQWACPDCHWLWEKMVFLEENITNQNLTLLEWAVLPPGFWNYFLALLEEVSKKHSIRLDVPYKELSEKEKSIVMHGTGKAMYTVSFVNESGRKNTYNSKFEWAITTLTRRYYDGWVEHWHYDDYVTNISCPDCNWYRLWKEPLSVYLNGLHIWELWDMNIISSQDFFSTLELNHIWHCLESLIRSHDEKLREFV